MNNTESKPSVLVAEDDHPIAELYELWLQPNYDLEVVQRGDAVLEILSERSFDAILLDRGLPDMSGDEVLATIRKRGIETPVGMVTGMDTDDTDADAADFDAYLVKPVSRESVLELVNRFLAVRSIESLELDLSEMRVERNVLEVELSDDQLENDERYQAIQHRIRKLETQKVGLRANPGQNIPLQASI